ncbi:MAG: SCO family protein [Ignavibacteriaceae bacterium]|nr:SCO family protein [Ignavibacteriaceae bacterium]
MKKEIFVISKIFLLTFLAVGILSCGKSEENKVELKTIEAKTDTTKKSCCSEDFGEAEYSDKSIYQLTGTWKDQNNRTLQLGKFQGKKVVLAMFFASCTYACPIIINDMQRIEKSLSNEKLANTQFVFISIDPERDSPEKLLHYANGKNLDLHRWSLLTGKNDDILELAALLGFKFRKDANGDFSHTNMITLLNEKGEITFQLIGLNQDIKEIIKKI